MNRLRATYIRHRVLLVTAAACLLVTGLVFFLIRSQEIRSVQTEFKMQAEDCFHAFDRELGLNLELLHSLVSFYRSSHEVERSEFRLFLDRAIQRHQTVLAFEWVPHVRQADRKWFEETKAISDGYTAFQILEANDKGQLVRAADRAKYFPVYLVEPMESNRAAHGFDLGSEPDRLAALERARDTGELTATKTIPLVQGKRGLLVFAPLYKEIQADASVDDRRASLTGFCVGVFRIGELISHTKRFAERSGLHFSLLQDDAIIGSSRGYDREAIIREKLQHRGTLNVAGQEWVMLCTPRQEFFKPELRWKSWGALFVGGILSASIGMIAHQARCRSSDLQRHVANRTQELTKAYADLKEAHDKLKDTQLQLIQAEKLESVGKLAAGVAHEVKNPLQTMLMGLTYLERKLPRTDTATTLACYDMRDAITRADGIVRGLLQMSGNPNLNMESEDLNGIIERALTLLNYSLNASRVIAVKHLAPNLPRLKMDRGKIEQVMINLFTNAIQAMPDGGTLTVSTYRGRNRIFESVTPEGQRRDLGECPGVVVDIEDTGSGIPKEQLPKLFTPFFTTKEIGEGTGLGLSVTRSIIELHGGKIELGNSPEGGARARITFAIVKEEPCHEKSTNTVCR